MPTNYYVQFWTNTLKKGFIYFSTYAINTSPTVAQQGWWIS